MTAHSLPLFPETAGRAARRRWTKAPRILAQIAYLERDVEAVRRTIDYLIADRERLRHKGYSTEAKDLALTNARCRLARSNAQLRVLRAERDS